MTIKLMVRCLAVRGASKFFVGDICEVLKLTFKDNESGNITIKNADGQKVYERIKVLPSKDIYAGDTIFRLRAVPEGLITKQQSNTV